MSAPNPLPGWAFWPLFVALAVLVAVGPTTLSLLFGPRPCTESATLPDVATPVTCAPPSVVSVRDSEHGPVVLCLCPTLTDGDDAVPSFEATEAP